MAEKTILSDTSILGLGNLIAKDVERIQPKAGRLDLLLRARNVGYWLLAFGGILVFATAWVSLNIPPSMTVNYAFTV